jgi:FMN phosphatase YigB (HAD superfamily)
MFVSQGLAPISEKDVLMIGDSYSSDIRGAIAAGIDQLWICPDDAALNDASRPATYKVSGLNKILPCLENLRS